MAAYKQEVKRKQFSRSSNKTKNAGINNNSVKDEREEAKKQAQLYVEKATKGDKVSLKMILDLKLDSITNSGKQLLNELAELKKNRKENITKKLGFENSKEQKLENDGDDALSGPKSISELQLLLQTLDKKSLTLVYNEMQDFATV